MGHSMTSMLILKIYLWNCILLYYSEDASPELLIYQFQDITYNRTCYSYTKNTNVVMRGDKKCINKKYEQRVNI